MDVGEAIGARRSIRKYEKRSIPSATLSQLLDSARLAPSANNRQEWSIVVVTDAGLLGKLVPVVGDQGFVGDCSAFLVGVAESGASMPAVDIAIALDHVSLRAVELGLGTCWIGDFDPAGLKDALGIPSDRDVPVCMTLGYPEGTPSPTERKTFSDLFHSDRWGSIWP
jgi:nitroreductase